MNAIRHVNDKPGRCVARLDIYGSIEDDYKPELNALAADINAVQYCRVIPANESNVVLRDYFMPLFPTYYRREEMPDTIIGDMVARVPVFARKWKYCDEMIKIEYAITHVQQTIEIRKNYLQSARKYDMDEVIRQIRKDMQI